MSQARLFCMVDSNDQYDYENESLVCHDIDTLETWSSCGVDHVVVLDALSYEIIETLNSVQHIEDYVWGEKYDKRVADYINHPDYPYIPLECLA